MSGPSFWYVDEDGDRIQVTDDNDLDAASNQMKSSCVCLNVDFVPADAVFKSSGGGDCASPVASSQDDDGFISVELYTEVAEPSAAATDFPDSFPEVEPLDESGFLFKAGAEFDIGEETLLYTSFSQGYRPGGINSRYNPFVPNTDSPRTFDADFVDSLDAGMKTTLADGRVALNLAAFYLWYDDVQIVSYDETGVFSVLQNGETAASYGLEGEISAAVTDQFTLGGSFTLMNAEYTADGGVGFDGGPVVLDGQALPATRETTFYVFGDYVMPFGSNGLDFFVHGDVAYGSSTPYTTDLPDSPFYFELPSYTQLNAAFGWEGDRWRTSLFINNLTDELVITGGLPPEGVARTRPRTIGVQFGMNF